MASCQDPPTCAASTSSSQKWGSAKIRNPKPFGLRKNSPKLERSLQPRKDSMPTRRRSMSGNCSIFTSSAMRWILATRRPPDWSTPTNMIKNTQATSLQDCSSPKATNKSGRASTTLSNRIFDPETKPHNLSPYPSWPPSCPPHSTTFRIPSWISPCPPEPPLKSGRKLWSASPEWWKKMLINSMSRRCLDPSQKSSRANTPAL